MILLYDNSYIKIGRVRTGLVAPIKDLSRNYFTMKEKQLDPSDHFFHCKANYEAASRGAYGEAGLKNLVI